MIVIPAFLAIMLGIYFNESSKITVENKTATSTPMVSEQKPLTPEEMIENATASLERDSKAHLESTNYFNEWVDHMNTEIDLMQKELEKRAERASTTGAKLDATTKSFNDLRDQLRF